MAQGFSRVVGMEEVRPMVIAKNSEVFAEGSPVTIDSSGYLAVASSSGEKIWGFCTQGVTALGTNQNGTVPQVANSAAVGFAPRVIGTTNVYFWADSDLAWTQTDVGAYADIASASAGVVTLNLAAGSSGQFFVIGLLSDIDPSAEGDTDRIVVKVAEPQELAFAQA